MVASPGRPWRVVAWFAAGVIGVSLFAPSLAGFLGPAGVGVGLVAVYSMMFRRPPGRPSSDGVRRLSGYLARPSITAVPEAVLLAAAAWDIWSASPSFRPSRGSVVLVGGALGMGWSFINRAAPGAAQVVKASVGGAGLVVAIATLVRGDACSVALTPGLVVLLLLLLALSVGLAALVGFWKLATLRRASAGSYILALFGLIELASFAAAPVGTSLLGDLEPWSAGVLVVGVALVAGLGAINPRAVEALVGTGVAAGGLYLALFGARLEVTTGPVSCHSFIRQVFFVGAFATIAFFVAGRSRGWRR